MLNFNHLGLPAALEVVCDYLSLLAREVRVGVVWSVGALVGVAFWISMNPPLCSPFSCAFFVQYNCSHFSCSHFP